MDLTIALNMSDSTYGWNAYQTFDKDFYNFRTITTPSGLRIFYSHPEDKALDDHHSFPAVPGLVPIVTLTPVRTHLLGAPFTECEDRINYTVSQGSKSDFIKKAESGQMFVGILLKFSIETSGPNPISNPIVSSCKYEQMLKAIVDKCRCFPSYAEVIV